jgi:acyl carrier protein
MPTDQFTQVLTILTRYVLTSLLGEENVEDLTADTPLLELGLLNSIETARMVAYIRETFGVRLPPASMNAGNFRDLNAIAALVVGLLPAAAGDRPVASGVDGEVRA